MGSLKKGQEYTCRIVRSVYPDKGIAELDGQRIDVKGALAGQTVKVWTERFVYFYRGSFFND